MTLPILIIGLAFLSIGLIKMTKDLRWGFYFLMVANFISVGMSRYIPLPLGLSIDFILILVFVILFLKEFRNLDWSAIRNPTFFLVSCWFVFNLFQLLNPESNSFIAWFYAMRGTALYFLLTMLIAYMILKDRDIIWFINFWFSLSIIAALWGIKQHFIGLDWAEKSWLSVPGNYSTHLLHGKLRVFSFFSDAGQFGAAQAHTGIVALVLGVLEKRSKRKVFYFFTMAISFYAMLLSGTRGAFAVPFIGGLTYLLLSKNFKTFAIGGILITIVFIVLKFTFIGQSNYQVQRLRSALDPNDASFQVRLENQKKLGVYLQTHPFGGGVGSGGYWGQRFSPDSFLANLALDSWYVRIAAEYGYVGLIFYLALLIIILLQALKRIRNTKSIAHKNKLYALFAGFCGILFASYGNQVLGQMPTGILVYLSIFFLTNKPSNASTQ